MNITIVDLTTTQSQVGDQVSIYSSDPNCQTSIQNQATKTTNETTYTLLTGLTHDIHREIT